MKIRRLRSLAGYALYRFERDGSDIARRDLSALSFAIAVIEETRDTVGPKAWAEIVERARTRDVKATKPKLDTRRKLRDE